MRADNLHREAALLSNTLHEFADSDVAGRKPVVDRILGIRKQWKQVAMDIAYFDKNGTLPDRAPARAAAVDAPTGTTSPGVAELKVELSRMNVNISKYQKKITDFPEHKKREQWEEDLAKMEVMKAELKQNIVKLTYETTQ